MSMLNNGFSRKPIPTEAIRRLADRYRDEHWESNDLPVDIDLVVEKHGIVIAPVSRLRNLYHVDAVLSIDGGTIWAHYDPNDPDYFDSRMRFSIAHEIGHLLLHGDYLEWMAEKVNSDLDTWVKVLKQESDQPYASQMEQEADEFAGRLLVPVEQLRKQCDSALESIGQSYQSLQSFSEDTVRNNIALKIHKIFDVSVQCMEVRLRKEGIYPPR